MLHPRSLTAKSSPQSYILGHKRKKTRLPVPSILRGELLNFTGCYPVVYTLRSLNLEDAILYVFYIFKYGIPPINIHFLSNISKSQVVQNYLGVGKKAPRLKSCSKNS